MNKLHDNTVSREVLPRRDWTPCDRRGGVTRAFTFAFRVLMCGLKDYNGTMFFTKNRNSRNPVGHRRHITRTTMNTNVLSDALFEGERNGDQKSHSASGVKSGSLNFHYMTRR